MNTHVEAAPAGLRVARWYLSAVAVFLIGVAAVTIVGHVGQAIGGTTLVFSQDDIQGSGAPGPAPAPAEGEAPAALSPEEASGSLHVVDVSGIALTVGAGAVLAIGAIALFRRARWAVPLGLAASAVAVGIGLLPAAIGVWAMDFYAMVDLSDAAPLFMISAALVTAALLSAFAIWRSRTSLQHA